MKLIFEHVYGLLPSVLSRIPSYQQSREILLDTTTSSPMKEMGNSLNLFSIDFVPQESDFSLESKPERYPLQPFVQRESAMKLPVSFGNDTCLIARFHKSKSLLFNKRLQNHEFHLGTLSGETRFRIFCRRGSCFSNCQHCFSLINLSVQLWL